MKNTKHSTTIFRTAIMSVVAFLALSCEREIEIDLPIMDPVLVLNGHINHNRSEYLDSLPDLYFFASQSGNPLARRFEPVFFEDVQAELWANGSFFGEFKSQPSMFQSDSWIYTVDGFESAPGTHYQIRARKSGLDPVVVDVALPNVTPIATARWHNRKGGLINFTFTDPGQRRRFYLIRMYTLLEEEARPMFFSSLDGDVVIQDFSGSLFEFEIPTGIEASMINDNFRGQQKSVLIELPKSMGLWGYEIDTNNIFIELFSINEDTYRYHTTEQAYYNTQDNPFAEPVNMHVNVKGGLGFVGGTVRSTRKVE